MEPKQWMTWYEKVELRQLLDLASTTADTSGGSVSLRSASATRREPSVLILATYVFAQSVVEGTRPLVDRTSDEHRESVR